MRASGDLDRPTVVMAAAAMGTAAVLVFSVLPIIGGAMAERYGLDDRGVGEVALSYFSAYALVALCSGLWIRRVNWRVALYSGYSGMFIGLLICATADTFGIARVGLSVTGVSAGLLFPVSLTLASDMERTDRAYAIKVSAEQLAPAGLLFLFSSAWFAGYGQAGLMAGIIVLVAICLLLSRSCPPRGKPDRHTEARQRSSLAMAIASLSALALSFAGFAGLWAFLERLGSEQGLESSFIAAWVGVGLVSSGVGPLGVAWLEDRGGRVLPICIATAVSLLSLFLLGGEVTATEFALTLLLLPLAYYFAVAYMLAVVADADHNGNMSGLIAFALAVGAGAGPMVFGILRSDGGPVLLVMGLMMGAGALSMAWMQARLGTVGRRPA